MFSSSLVYRGVATAVAGVSMIQGPRGTGAPTCVSKNLYNVIHSLIDKRALMNE